MDSKIKRIAIVFFAFYIVAVALFAVLTVFDVITMSEFKDYVSKVGIAALVVGAASVVVSAVLAMNKES